MFNLIRKALGLKDTADKLQSDTANEIRIEIAACVVLVEVAESDSECTEDEIDHVLETMKSTFNLSREHAEEMIELARDARNKSVDLWQFTNQINQSFNHSEKIKLLEAVWQVIYADGRIDKHEDYLVHKLASLLRLQHKELIDAKIKTKKDKSE
ncbi:TerB family tellurite resistance protein [candidate division KSB1 bacterium]|nr:TerB family tellurite resistance protein [candidate division KSB1 bacterium]